VPGTIDGIFRNQGEVCLAGSRLYVQRPIYDEFGGMKDSGIGREGGLHSEDFFTEAKAVVLQFPS
jgi:acyl-CoA reductase-like NAD-dependent aldehyde dehydrogenase